MKRLWFLLRVALHDWMWEGGSKPDHPRRLARSLPLYFSDPYYTTAITDLGADDDSVAVTFAVSSSTWPVTISSSSSNCATYTWTDGTLR